jgi:superkiller protein 3
LYYQEKLDEAVAAYRKAIELEPRFSYAYNGLGNALRAQKKLDEAITCYRKAIEIDPKYAYAYNGLGAILCDVRHDYENAAACFRKAIELDPRFAFAYLNLGNALQGEKKFDEAIAAYRKAIEIDPKYAHAYNRLGAILCDVRRDYENAAACFRKAIEIDPKRTDAYNRLAWLFATCSEAKLRDPNQAVALAKKAVELAPNDWSYLNTLGAADYRAGDWKGAITALEKSMELRNGGDSNDWFFLAMAHGQLGQKVKAREWYDRAVQWMDENAPTDEELRRLRAEAAELLELKEKK